jgi:asparagine synthase (glutamine-hydrolysing)
MCGIAGFLTCNFNSNSLDDVQRMSDKLIHRGPDSSGSWSDPTAGVYLAHRRLSIVDISPTGHQPMFSQSGRYVFIFNGEVYNHVDLRKQLAAVSVDIKWKGSSDTETLLACFDQWGIENTLKKIVGMFAFAVWDKKLRTLTLARDRMGEKPLYFGWQGNTFIFGSELKALRSHSAFSSEIDRNALALFMRHGYIPTPYSIYQGISKLLPGSLVQVSLEKPEPCISTYWSLVDVAKIGVSHPFTDSKIEAVARLDELVRASIKHQMIADVPLGAFLSGGIDSSLVVAIMQTLSPQPVKTFTIGFHEAAFDEAQHAKSVASHLGTNHTELYVTSQDAQSVIPKLPHLYDEPFADSSQIPTFLVAQMAREHVTVALSGDAGDELFGGYSRYHFADNVWHKLSWLPMPIRTIFARLLQSVSPRQLNTILPHIFKVIGQEKATKNFGATLKKGAEFLTLKNSDDFYHLAVSSWKDPTNLVLKSTEYETVLTGSGFNEMNLNFMQSMMGKDMLSYLPDDILVKVDRAAMGASLETRVPFLDHRIVEFSWSLPIEFNVSQRHGKLLLRDMLANYLPRQLFERPKQGFGVPIEQWLRLPLRTWAEDLINESTVINQGFLDSKILQKKWAEHTSGQFNWQSQLWSVLMFQAWLEEQK